MSLPAGHTLAKGVYEGCPKCVEFGKSEGNPAHVGDASESRLLRGICAALAVGGRGSVDTFTEGPPTPRRPETDAEYAARLLEAARKAMESR